MHREDMDANQNKEAKNLTVVSEAINLQDSSGGKEWALKTAVTCRPGWSSLQHAMGYNKKIFNKQNVAINASFCAQPLCQARGADKWPTLRR